LAALLAGQLPVAERESIADHAASCAACHQLLDRLVGVTRSDRDGNARDRQPLAKGTRVGRYVIGDWLGVGGMGIVYAAVDSELQRPVAIKVLRPDGGGDAFVTKGRERLMREARVLASLSHPNVVTVFDVGTHDGDLFLAMELVDGGSLNAWLSKTRTIADIVDRLIDAGRGIAAAHAAGIVHRDVKPDNILVGRDGRTRVTDFGLARLDALAEPEGGAREWPASSSDLTRTGARMGTPVYMAPEQHAGTADARTDQWAFCAMVYELVAGVRPFPVDDLDDRTKAIADGKVAPPAPGRRVPSWLLRLAMRGMRADPDDRWPSMSAVVDALVRGRRRRGRIVAASVIATLAVASIATTVVLARGTGESSAARPVQTSSLDIVMPDPRTGCNCPMSACDGSCVSVCKASHYTIGPPIAGISEPNRQEALLGVSGDGDTLLYLANTGCRLDHIWLARRHGNAYESTDLTAKLDLQRVAIFEGCCSLAASGRALVMARPDQHGFMRVRLDGTTPLALDPSDDLGELVPRGPPHVNAQYPAMSPDELTLYYRVFDRSLDPGDLGPLDAVYAAHRTDRNHPFAAGTRLPGRARYYDVVTGVSADGLSLFMSSEYRTHVLVRPSLDKPFADPGENMLPAWFWGWRAAPVADCRRIATTVSPGGCANEDIVWLEATP
jgi:hypothetical protein